MEVRESIARTTATSGGAVLFAGSTVIIALLSLAVAGIPLVTTLGYTSAIVVLIAVLAAITLMPAILGLLGPRVNALPLPGHARAPRRAAPRLAALGPVRRRPPVAGRPRRGRHPPRPRCAAARSAPRADRTSARCPTDTQSRQAYDRMTRGFGAGSNGPMLIAVDLSKPATNDQKQLDSVKQQQSDQQAQQQQQDQATELRPGGADPAAGAVPRVQGLRPAAADAADGPAEDQGRQVRDPAARQQRRDGRRLHAHRHDRAVLAQDRGPRQPPCATTSSPRPPRARA